MEIPLEVKIDSPDYEVDMKAGLESLLGTSDTIRTISESILKKRVVKSQYSGSPVRTNMKKTFKGSYGMFFSIFIEPEKQPEFKEIGRQAFLELITYFMHDALNLVPDVKLGKKAQQVLSLMGEDAEELTSILRGKSNGLRTMHEISVKFGYPISVSYKKSNGERFVLIKLDRSTEKNFKATIGTKNKTIYAAVTRFNSFTGNGRLIQEGEDETVSFGFGLTFKEMAPTLKKVFSTNLNENTGVVESDFKYLKLEVNELKRSDGKIIKFIVKSANTNA